MRSFINHQIERYYKKSLRPRLFEMSKDDPEIAHEWAMEKLLSLQRHSWRMRALQWLLTVRDHRLGQHLFGLWFPSPVGLAGGFDKYCQAPHALAAHGFGFIEVGGITPLEQGGNERPRIRRLLEEHSLLNRMGFNNPGVQKARNELQGFSPLHIPIGCNIGKGKNTSLERAADDYCAVLRVLYECADYFVINISSPNTPGLRELQKTSYLRDLLAQVQAVSAKLAATYGLEEPKPILLKLAPEVPDEDLPHIVSLLIEYGFNGLILTNTVLVEVNGLTWGKSGPSLFPRMLKIIEIVRQVSSSLPIVAVGGINSGERAIKALRAGANLIQVYTGLVYEGPTLPWKINSEISRYMGRNHLCDMHALRHSCA